MWVVAVLPYWGWKSLGAKGNFGQSSKQHAHGCIWVATYWCFIGNIHTFTHKWKEPYLNFCVIHSVQNADNNIAKSGICQHSELVLWQTHLTGKQWMMLRFTYKLCRSIVRYFRNLLTKAHFLKCLLHMINIYGRNYEKTTRLFLKHGYFEFSDFTR